MHPCFECTPHIPWEPPECLERSKLPEEIPEKLSLLGSSLRKHLRVFLKFSFYMEFLITEKEKYTVFQYLEWQCVMWLGKVCLGVSYSCYSTWRQRSFVCCAEASWASQIKIQTHSWGCSGLDWHRQVSHPRMSNYFFLMTTKICEGKKLGSDTRRIWLTFSAGQVCTPCNPHSGKDQGSFVSNWRGDLRIMLRQADVSHTLPGDLTKEKLASLPWKSAILSYSIQSFISFIVINKWIKKNTRAHISSIYK